MDKEKPHKIESDGQTIAESTSCQWVGVGGVQSIRSPCVLPLTDPLLDSPVPRLNIIEESYRDPHRCADFGLTTTAVSESSGEVGRGRQWAHSGLLWGICGPVSAQCIRLCVSV